MPDDQLNFASDFAAPDEEQWLSLVEKALKGKPFETVMQHNTRDGIVVEALGTKKSIVPNRQSKRAHGNWSINSLNWGTNAEWVNKDILTDLERGASAIAITVAESGSGVSPSSLPAALEGVYLDMVPLTLILREDFEAGVDAYEKLIKERAYTSGVLSGSLGVDPIGTLGHVGRLATTVEKAVNIGAEIAKRWAKQQPHVATFKADGTVFSNAGASECTEIAAAVSSAIVYMRAMEQAGLPLEVAASQIQFTLSATAELWLTIAKFRAARRVWAGVLSACGVENVPMKINGVTASNAVTMKDPWVNILRGTAACFAAGIGGADVITTLPHDIEYNDCDSFSRRIARNIQIILTEESHLASVSDPAAGSFSLEKLTSDLAEKSANLLADLESSGGVVANLRSGALVEKITKVATQRAAQIRRREISITGVSEFPNIHETPLEGPGNIYMVNPAQLPPAGEEITPLPFCRLAQEFENLRFESDDLTDENGARPKIALINLGVPADFTARAAFSKNFFEAGGIEAVASPGLESIENAVATFSASGASLAVICGSDQRYNEMGIEVAQALKQAGCVRLYLAGKPENLSALESAGVDEAIFAGCDVIDALERAYAALGSISGDLP